MPPFSPSVIFAAAFGGAILFHQLARAQVPTILAVLVMVLLVWIVYPGAFDVFRSNTIPPPKAQSPLVAADPFTRAIEGRKEVATDRYSIKRFSKLRFLSRNPELAAIAHDLRFVRIYDKARYGDLLLFMDKMQKTYMYILAGRYELQSYVGTFQDLRQSVSEILYSLYFAVPSSFRHSYGFEPYPVIERNTDHFRTLSRKMLSVLENYAKGQGEHYFPPVAPSAYEQGRENRLP